MPVKLLCVKADFHLSEMIGEFAGKMSPFKFFDLRNGTGLECLTKYFASNSMSQIM